MFVCKADPRDAVSLGDVSRSPQQLDREDYMIRWTPWRSHPHPAHACLVAHTYLASPTPASNLCRFCEGYGGGRAVQLNDGYAVGIVYV